MKFETLKNLIRHRTDIHIEPIQKAYELALVAHKGQFRKSGEPYIIHPLEVAIFLVRLSGEENTICAALLHDVIEDAPVEKKASFEATIYQEFGEDVFFLVQAMTKDGNITDCEKQQKEYFCQIQKALELDVSIFFLKMADLIHNAKTINALKPHKQDKWITELKNVYIPMMTENFHRVSFYYHEMYLNLINEIEKIIDQYEQHKDIS